MTIEGIEINNKKEDGEKVVDVETKDDLLLLQSETEDVTIEDINKLTLSDAQWVSSQGVMKALASLNKIDPSLGKKISLLIKKGDILGIQLSLGMIVNDTNSNKNADGVFGRSTLNNLGAGKVVKTNLTATSEIEQNGETVKVGPNTIIIHNMDEVRKWGWSGETVFIYTSPRFAQIFHANGRFIQKMDATEPQSLLQQAAFGAEYTVNIIKGNWAYNENGQMVLTYDRKVEKNKRTENSPEATKKVAEAIEKMRK